MRAKRLKSRAGLTLVEIMAATAVLAVAVLGVSGYRYYAALDARKAEMESSASRIALLLCENWRGVNGDTAWDPAACLGAYLTIANDPKAQVPTVPDFNLLGKYVLALNDTSYTASLWWKDAGSGLRALHVAVTWSQPGQGKAAEAGPNKEFRVTTYATY